MKKLVLFSVSLFLAGSVFAANLKIGVLDVQKIVQKAPKVIKMRNDMQSKLRAKVKPQVAKLKTLQTALGKDVTNLQKNGPTMTAAKKTKLQQKITTGQTKLQQLQMGVRKQLMADQNVGLQQLMKLVEGAVNKVAKADKLNLVIAKTSVAYNDANLDITDKVIKLLK